MSTTETKILTYKGQPLMRKNDLMYYGSMENKHIIMLKVLESSPLKDVTLAKQVSVELMLNDPDISAADRVQKSVVRDGLYEALDVASVWLTRTLNAK